MVFTTDSQIVKNYVLLINNGLKKIEEVPDNIFNLKEMVQSVLDSQIN